ncbi:MAG: Gfo/Idh/MocA family protein [Gaiellales bacterium]
MIGVAILGSGFMARTHAAAWAAHADRAAVRVVASRTRAGAAGVAEGAGADATEDLAAAIARDDVDVVDICLPTALHRPWAEAAFAAGKDVLLEKPIALDVADAEAIIAARDASGRRLLVGLVLRFWPEYEELHALVAQGAVGTVRSVTALRLSPPPDWNDWMTDPAQSGGAAVDLMVHDFDQVAMLLGDPLRVHAGAVPGGPHGAPQHVVATVTCANGTAVVEGGLLLPPSYPFTSGIRVLGDDGVLEYPFSAGASDDGGNIGGVDQSANALQRYPASGARERVAVAAGDPWARQCGYLLDRIAGELPVDRATGEDALRALRIALAANRSIVSGAAEAA